MPRVDRGSYVVDVGEVLKLGRSERLLLIEWALSEGALLVTEPTVVSIQGAPGGLLVSVGVGSIVSFVKPPVGRPLELARPEWVDGCFVGSREPRLDLLRGEAAIDGIVAAIDAKDPVARLLNGSRGEASGPLPREYRPLAVAALDGNPVVALGGEGGYVSTLSGGEALERLEYIARLASSCSGRGGD